MSVAVLDRNTQTTVLEAELNFVDSGVAHPRTYTYQPPNGEPRTNYGLEPHRVDIHDLRRTAADASLDHEGFALIEQHSAVDDFTDDARVQSIYYAEAEALIKQLTGADRVLVFDHTVRRRVPGADDYRSDGPRQPATRVHVDHTERSGPQNVRDRLPEDAEQLLAGRVQIINLWRPLKGPLRDTPLAVADARSVAPDDLIPSDLVYPHRVGETYSVRYNPAQRWFYVPEMQPHEVLLLKCYDSETDGGARFAPHGAFVDPTTPADAPPRESIELRTLVFHDKR